VPRITSSVTSPDQSIVITGVGVVSPNGIGCDAYARACLAGESGLKRPSLPEHGNGKTSSLGIVEGFDPSTAMPDADVRRTPRMVPMAVAAAREAIAFSKLPTTSLDESRAIGVALGSGGGGLGFVEVQYSALFSSGRGKLSPFAITAGTHGNLSSELSIQLGLRGPSHVISTGCTSSTDALGYARYLIRSGLCDVVIAGGADSPIMPGILAGFERMGVVSTKRWDDPRQSSRPFSADRDGFVLSEGAWMFVLESAAHAVRRGAKVLAEFVGYGSTCDAYHRVQIAPDAAESSRAIDMALADAGIDAAAIDYVNLHGTGTPMNDRLETLAIKRSLGDRAMRIPMSSTKSMIGHPQGACGAAGLAATLLCLAQGKVHPTVNVAVPDPECDLDYVVDGTRACDAEYVLCNCIAFGSKNSAMVLKKG
jgi:3-oxoacyl-[acyl-carrier-protein] synthase II